MVAKITLITATYNAESYLPILIESLKAQTSKKFEWIVIDGLSSDGTVGLLNSAGNMVTKSLSESDFGIYHAINKAIQLVDTEYYLVIGADDILNPNSIEFLTQALHTEADVYVSKVEQYCGLLPGYKRRRYLGTVFPHSVGCLIRKSLHSKLGFYSNRFPIAADQFFLRMVEADGSFRIESLNFISGKFSSNGLSTRDAIGSLCEFYRVSLEVGNGFYFETLMFILRLCKFSLLRFFGKNG